MREIGSVNVAFKCDYQLQSHKPRMQGLGQTYDSHMADAEISTRNIYTSIPS